MFCSKC